MRLTLSQWVRPVAALVAFLVAAASLTGYLQARAAHRRALFAQGHALQASLLGATQNLDRAITPVSGATFEETLRHLVHTEASLAQAEIMAATYQQATGILMPLANAAGLYAHRVRSIREEAARNGQLSDQQKQPLAEIRSDVRLLREAIDPEALAGAGRAKAAANFANVAPNLKLPEAKTVLTLGPGK